MQNAWILTIASVLLCTAACAGMEPVEGTGTASSATMADGEDGDDREADTDTDVDATDSDLGYGWETTVKNNKAIGKYSLSDIVTNGKVVIRKDGRSCLGCHSWSEYQDKNTFCARVNDFLKMPTVIEGGANPPSAKPAELKKLLKDWKEAGCPN